MKRILMGVAALAIGLSSPALADKKDKPHPEQTGASETGASQHAPGQAAKSSESTTDTAKDHAPGQKAKTDNDATKPGASEHAPGQKAKSE